MFEFAKKLMMGRELNFDKGAIFLLKEPICMMPVRTVAEIISLTKNDQKNILYFAGKHSGTYWFKKMAERFYNRPMPMRDTINWGNDILAMAGYGVSIIKKFNEKNKEMVFRLENSTICSFIGKSNKPVDHIYRGFAAAAGVVIFGEDSDALEVMCKATGAPCCEFVVRPTKNLNLKDPLVKEQLGYHK